jgi:16S rRNA (cytidine1402-2'-O)-methyltransferase
MSSERAGTLYLVATPIGNLGDITRRAVQVLSQVRHVAAEDTRRTRGLLSHLAITGKELHTLDANASERALARVVELLAAGEDVALVTDAGTPGISDPGREIVRRALGIGAHVTATPGASALTTAVALSGLVSGGWLFLGFLPRQGGSRREALARIGSEPLPVVLFEAPHRLERTLSDLCELDPTREIAICRELTKLHEEVLHGSLADLAALEREWLGEIVLVLGAGKPQADAAESDAALAARARRLLAAGATARAVADELTESSQRSRREVYELVLKSKSELDQGEG